jgi:hypothetical protein
MELAESEGDNALIDDAVKSLAALAERRSATRSRPSSPARPTPTTAMSR